MKNLSYIILLLMLASCGADPSNKSYKPTDTIASNSSGSRMHDSSINNFLKDNTVSGNATYFIVVADTGLNYFILREKMNALSRKLRSSIDTMGRHFNKTKNLIALPDNDTDELYAGDYFPRRFPSETLSLEYLNFYQNQSRDKTIALVCGIYETENKADSILHVLQTMAGNAFKIKADIYLGCIH